MNRREVLSPAKVNLLLAVTGRRADGYHDLVSLVAPLDWGDLLAAESAPDGITDLVCDEPGVPAGEANLVMKAAAAFRAATGWTGGVRFLLRKAVPMGAGLGGGSSNAATALRLLNPLASHPLSPERLIEVAATVGSDCPLFLASGPVVMRGRGERLEPLPPDGAARLAGRRVLLFKPAFPVATAWAYRQLAQAGRYEPAEAAERRLAAWRADPAAPLEDLLLNTLEAPVFAKFPALPALLDALARDFGLRPRMSGSGSTCFALLPAEGAGPPDGALAARVREAWGPSAWIRFARFAANEQIPV